MELIRRTSPDPVSPSFPRELPAPCSLFSAPGLSGRDPHPLRVLWIERDAPYAARMTSLLEKTKNPSLLLERTERLDEAIRRIQERNVDAVLLDIRPPGLSVVEFIRAIHQTDPSMPLVILADPPDDSLARRIIYEGAQDCLPKRHLHPRVLSRSLIFAVARAGANQETALPKTKFPWNPPPQEPTIAPFHGSWAGLYPPLQDFPDQLEILQRNPQGSAGPGEDLERLEATGQRVRETVQRMPETRPGENRPKNRLASVGSSDRPPRILVLEPSDKDFQKLETCLKGHNRIRTVRARTIGEAGAILTRHVFDLVCLEYFLPDGTGHDFLARVNESGLDVPTVIITAHSDPMAAAQIIQAGAYDYLAKQKLSRTSLFRVLGNAMEKARYRRLIEKARRKILELSILDDLTGLYNRRHFMEVLDKETKRALRYKTSLVLCMMDVDEFKRINDTLGHQAGDMVLRQLGNLLRASIRLSDTACRYGGEEFALILPNTHLREAKVLGERLRRMVEIHPFKWKGTSFQVTLSFGLARMGRGTIPTSPTLLLEEADQALYRAKREGKNKVVASGGDRPDPLP